MRARSWDAHVAVGWVAAAGALVLGVALLAGLALPASAQTDEPPERLAGPTRFHTAATIATSTFEQADVAHLATGAGFADALAASFAAGSVDGPVLLSAPDAVPAPTRQALAALDVERVVIIGGFGVIGEGVDDALADAGYATERVSGANRFETAAAVARRYGQQQVGAVDGERTALLATGAHFADALAAGPIAARARLPLLLTPPERAAPSATRALEQLGIDKIMLLGGPAAISEDVEGFYRDQGYALERIGGPTSMDTAWLLADTAAQDFGFSHERVLLARGDAYPDALAASAHAAAAAAPIVLSGTSTDLSAPTREWLQRTCRDVTAVTALGGTDAISEAVRDDAERAATCEGLAAEETAVAVTADGRVVVLNATTGEERRELMTGVPTDDPAANDIAVTPDRSAAYVTVPGDEAGEPTDIVRVPTDGGAPQVVATDASSPAVSPDGQTLAYAVHPGDVGDPDPRLVRRDLATGEEVRLASGDDPHLHFVSDVSWTADGAQLAVTVGEINTGVYVIDADAASMQQVRRLGPGQQQADTDVSWSDTAAFGRRLAVTETCCDTGEARWRVLEVDPGDGSLHGTLMGEERLEAVHLDSNADASALLAVEGGGLDGGTLRRWNGAGEAHAVAEDVVAAAW